MTKRSFRLDDQGRPEPVEPMVWGVLTTHDHPAWSHEHGHGPCTSTLTQEAWDKYVAERDDFDAYLKRREAQDGGTHSRRTGIAHND